jgi:hypothetical protein
MIRLHRLKSTINSTKIHASQTEWPQGPQIHTWNDRFSGASTDKIQTKTNKSERQSTAILANETENSVKLQQELQESAHLAPWGGRAAWRRPQSRPPLPREAIRASDSTGLAPNQKRKDAQIWRSLVLRSVPWRCFALLPWAPLLLFMATDCAVISVSLAKRSFRHARRLQGLLRHF